MTERAMPNQKIFPILIFLYEVCKEVLEEFFEYKCDVPDGLVSSYIQKHIGELRCHVKNSKCHTCFADENPVHPCIKVSKNQFMSLFEHIDELSPDDNLFNSADGLKVKNIEMNEISVQTLQYLVLASKLNPDEHDWIVTLYQSRLEVSNFLYENITDRQFSEIWDRSEKVVFNIISNMWSKRQVDRMAKQLERCRRSMPDWDIVKSYWDTMQGEFDLQMLDNLQENLHDVSLTTKEAKSEQTLIFIKSKHVIVGDDGHIGIPAEDQSKIDKILELQQEHDEKLQFVVEKLKVLGNVKNQHPETGKETAVKAEGTDEVSSVGAIASHVSTTDKDNEVHEVEFKLKTSATDEKLMESITTTLQGMKLQICEGTIEVKFVNQGSIVIGTYITSNIVTNSKLFLNAVEQFLRIVLEKCHIDTTEERTLEVDIAVGRIICIHDKSLMIDEERSELEKSSLVRNQSEKLRTVITSVKYCSQCQKKDVRIKELEEEIAAQKYVHIMPQHMKALMSKKVDTVADRTLYEPVHEQEIMYADFPHDKVTANQDYYHTTNDTVVVRMIKDANYFLIRKIGDWSELVEIGGSSFFVLSKYTDEDNPTLTQKRKPSITPYKRRTPDVEERQTMACMVDKDQQTHCSVVSEDIYDYIPGDGDETDPQQESAYGVLFPSKRAVTRSLSEQVTTQLKRRSATKLSSSKIEGMTPDEKRSAYQRKRSQSLHMPDKTLDDINKDVN